MLYYVKGITMIHRFACKLTVFAIIKNIILCIFGPGFEYLYTEEGLSVSK